MKHCLVFVASLFLAFIAISSASTATPADWTRAASDASSLGVTEASGSADQSSWMTVPSARLATFVLIRL